MFLAISTCYSRPEFVHTSEIIEFILDFSTGLIMARDSSSYRDYLFAAPLRTALSWSVSGVGHKLALRNRVLFLEAGLQIF
jgi:hypothetical protein